MNDKVTEVEEAKKRRGENARRSLCVVTMNPELKASRDEKERHGDRRLQTIREYLRFTGRVLACKK